MELHLPLHHGFLAYTLNNRTGNLGNTCTCDRFEGIVKHELRHLHLQHRQHTSHEEETSNNRRKTKASTAYSSITTRRYHKCAIRESAHSSRYFNILYMGPLFSGEFC
jgi:hypothetical protein